MSRFAFRANKAAEDASQWHQGSGEHADRAASMVEHHEREAHRQSNPRDHVRAAKAWAEAAEEEARYLRRQGGGYNRPVDPYRNWKRSNSGKATGKAVEASKKAGLDFDPME